MGIMIDGRWHGDDEGWASEDGEFRRAPTQFHCAIGDACHPAEAGRYHLYVSLACPWAHRAVIFRAIKGLESIVPMTVVHPHMLERGWEFRPDPEPLYGARCLHELYARSEPGYSGRVTVPVLWDRIAGRIVCNESAEIIRMFNSAFDALTGNRDDYYPEALRAEIDAINDFVYDRVNNGVYRCGFATRQAVYEAAFDALFEALDVLEGRLGRQRYLVGDRLTEADWRLFTTLLRFDVVYHGHFKCNRNRIVDMPNLWAWLRELYQFPAIRETVDIEQIKQHYYFSHATINPTRIVPRGPGLDLERPHGRDEIGL